MDKKALETEMLGKILIILLALAALAWILYTIIKSMTQAKFGF